MVKTLSLSFGRGIASVLRAVDQDWTDHPLIGPPKKATVFIQCGQQRVPIATTKALGTTARLCGTSLLALAQEDPAGMATLVAEVEDLGRVVVDPMLYQSIARRARIAVAHKAPRVEQETLRFMTFIPFFDPFPHFLSVSVNLRNLRVRKRHAGDVAKVDPSL